MTERRSSRRVLVLVSCVLVGGTTMVAADDRPFGGRVVDPLGTAIEHAQVLLVPERDASMIPAPVYTDEAGRFLVRELAPMAYRIVAVKEGYAVFLDRVHTGVRSTIDVVLHPLPRKGQPGASDVTDDASWALRVPRRSIWQDVAPAPVQPVQVIPARFDVAQPARLVQSIEGRVDQVIAVAAPSSEGWSGGVQGSETRMSLASTLGERTRVEVGGRYASLDSGGFDEGASTALSTRDETTFNVDVRYQGTPTDRVDVAAFWSERDAIVGDHARVAEPLRQADSAWGYDARWTRHLADGSSVAARVDYSAAMLARTNPGWPESGAGFSTVTAESRRHHAVGAGGTYDRVLGRRHHARFDFDARFVDAGLPALRLHTNGTPMARLDRAGWELEARAEDTWMVGGPISWTYGLTYRHRIAQDGAQSSIVVPRAGATWSGDGVTVQMVVTRPELAQRSTEAGVLPFGADTVRSSRIGYEASIESALPFGLSVRGGWTFDPVGAAPIDMDPRASDPYGRPLFVAGGDVASSERVLALFHDGGVVTTWIDWTRGEVEGALSPVLPYGLPFYAVRASGATYRVGRLGIRVPSTGTQVHMEHRQVNQTAPRSPESSGDGLAQRGVELRVVQDVLRYPSSAWRVLVSLESSEVGEQAVDTASRLEGERLPEAVQRVNAGVSVAF